MIIDNILIISILSSFQYIMMTSTKSIINDLEILLMMNISILIIEI